MSRDQDVGFKVVGCTVQAVKCKVQVLVQGSGFRVPGSGFRVQGPGTSVGACGKHGEVIRVHEGERVVQHERGASGEISTPNTSKTTPFRPTS